MSLNPLQTTPNTSYAPALPKSTSSTENASSGLPSLNSNNYTSSTTSDYATPSSPPPEAPAEKPPEKADGKPAKGKKHKKGPNGRPFTDPNFKPNGRPFTDPDFKPNGRPFQDDNKAEDKTTTEASTSKQAPVKSHKPGKGQVK